jgi:hypothetical protein
MLTERIGEKGVPGFSVPFPVAERIEGVEEKVEFGVGPLVDKAPVKNVAKDHLAGKTDVHGAGRTPADLYPVLVPPSLDPFRGQFVGPMLRRHGSFLLESGGLYRESVFGENGGSFSLSP